MSFYFQVNQDPAQQRILDRQFMELNRQRHAVESQGYGVMADLLRRTVGLTTNSGSEIIVDGRTFQANTGLTPADAFREFDRISTIIKNPVGEFSTLGRVLANDRSVNIGKEIFEYRKVSALANKAKTSMSGQTGVNTDHTAVSYAGTLIPFTDYGYGRNFREIEAMRADGYDALVDDAREADLVVRRKLVTSLWTGFKDENGQLLTVKDKSWAGIKGDPTVVQDTFTLDILDPATKTIDIYNLFKAKRDVLRIQNNLSLEVDVPVSREIYSVLEQPFTEFTTGYGNLKQMIEGLTGIREIYEDPALTGNEFAMLHIGFEGLSSVTGMALSSVAVPRMMYNDSYSFIKAAATGFIARTDYDAHKTCLYAKKA